MMVKTYDAIIIGGGVVGSAIARELSRYQLDIAVLEKENDVCCATSGHNSGVLHAGYNNRPGSKMARLCVAGNAGFDQVAAELDIPFRRTGKLVIGFDGDDLRQLKRLKQQGQDNGCRGLCIVGRDRIKELIPDVQGEYALYSPNTGVLDPFQLTIGLAENAHHNGVRYLFGQQVTAIRRQEGLYHIQTTRGWFVSRWVINSAGLYSDRIANMLGVEGYQINPCRGEYFILDQRIGYLLPLPAYPVPNEHSGGLGIHLTPTVDGNIMIGPSADYIDQRDDYAVTRPVMDMLLEEGSRIFPLLRREHFIRNFAGIRPKLTGPGCGGFHDFVIECAPQAPNTVNLIGIESPGLTASTPIAREVVQLIGERERLEEKCDFDPLRRRPPRLRELSVDEQQQMIRENPDYGQVICRCELISKAEVMAAINNPLGVRTMTGIKYRCRSMMGRCQGGYCQTRIAEMLLEKQGGAYDQLLYHHDGSNLFYGRVR